MVTSVLMKESTNSNPGKTGGIITDHLVKNIEQGNVVVGDDG